ncbi:PREDICTED: CDK5 and ABL1 enzyme substrate 1-like [Priapulus caudatus]|uniref:CDK5 and ABL1 enzyme substrate 1-like n=1 Tax=Priapulus caudatus TaxID=37621 RepID=A0ABM1F3H9_PRICU|nr:PREDICTED: CDK5 and ABL1 enzyme substrate 1-like [Priapulus caudatus]
MSVSFKTRYWRSVSETPHTHSSTEDDMPRLSYGVSLRKRLFRQASVSGSTSTINDDLPQLVHGSSRRRRYSSSSSWSSSSASPMKELRGLAPSRSRIKDDRVVYLRTQGAPFSIFSVLSYNKARERVIVRCGGAASVAAGEAAGGRRRHASTSRMDGSDILAMAGVEPTPDDDEASFAAYLVPRRRESHEGAPAGDTDPDAADPAGDYDPSRLDNPELIAGRHRTTLRFCSHLASVIDYVRPGELKAELNAKFAARHPRIDLTLSKLRSLKRDVRRTAADAGLDLYTVAAAYVYFERTVLLGCLNKANRKFVAGTALLLSAKLNDCKGEQLTALLGAIEDRMRVDKRELLAYEFPLLVALKFALHTPDAEVSPHYQRLLYET